MLFRDWKLRNNLRSPNCDPKLYWENVENCVTPVRGSSLTTNHLNGSEGLHPSVVRLLHDRTAHVSTKMLLTKNNGYYTKLVILHLFPDLQMFSVYLVYFSGQKAGQIGFWSSAER